MNYPNHYSFSIKNCYIIVWLLGFYHFGYAIKIIMTLLSCRVSQNLLTSKLNVSSSQVNPN
jgi:hypothetical protein